jgi:pilus assembly protein CpaC
MKLISIILFLSFALSSGSRLLRAAPAAAPQNERISMTVGHSFVIDTTGDLERVAVATEDVIEAVAVTQREVVLNAKSVGETSVIIWQRNNGGRRSYDVTVEPSSSKADALRRNLRKDVGDAVEGELNDKTVLLRGSVRNQAEGDKAMAIAAAFGLPVNLMTVATPPAAAQILLKVRFADVDRTASLSLGANLFSTGAGKTIGGVTTQQFSPPSTGSVGGNSSSSFNLSNALNLFLYRPELNLGATIEALAAKGLVQILAEPNVLATDGKQASFLAGGEFPYPVVQSSINGTNNVTILFREFGIRLNFTPTITPRGTIKLEVAPEVSSLDYANGLTYQGFNIPGLDVRRVKTEIELENNQSFAIAGLLDNRVTQNLSKVPGLGDIPLFGKLFQSESISRSNSELLVVVTPELVQPIPAGAPQPGPVMPKPFLKEGATTPTMANPPDTRPVSALPEVPFVPSETKPAALPGALPDPAAAFTNSLKGK